MVGRVEQQRRGETDEGHGHGEGEGNEHEKDLVPAPSSDVTKNLDMWQYYILLKSDP